MGRAKRTGGSSFEVEWITVSYRTLVAWGSLLAAIVVIGGGALLWQRMQRATEREEVERIVLVAERALSTARSAVSVPEEELAEVDADLARARERLSVDELPGARAAADEVQRRLRELGSRASEAATLLRVEGNVQVKRIGAVDWINAEANMPLRPGDLLKTGNKARAEYSSLDKSTHTLGDDSLLRIERSTKDRSGKTDVAVQVRAGRLTVYSETQEPGSRSEVLTPNLSANVESNAVVGVEYDQEGQQSKVDVIQGRARVRAGDATIELGASERVLVSPAGVEQSRLPAVPKLVAPPMYKLVLVDELQRRPLELEWQSARGARAYKIELGQSPLFTQLLASWNAHPTTFVAVDRPLPVGRYYWRVTALDRDGVESGPSPANVFRVSDALPSGLPPPLEVSSTQALGEGVFLIEGTTRVGIILSIDDGSRLQFVQPQQSGAFRQIIAIPYEGDHVLTVTARDSQGLETVRRVRVEVKLE